MSFMEKKSASCVPVFSVESCTNPSAARGQSYGFSLFVTEPKTEYGDFDLATGIFTAKTAGNYLLNFTGHAHLVAAHRAGQMIMLKINSKRVALSYNYSSVETSGFQPAVISVVVPLKVGDRVGIFANSGKLYDDDGGYKTRFYGLLFLDYSS